MIVRVAKIASDWCKDIKVKVTRSKRGGDVIMSPCLWFSAAGPQFQKQVYEWVGAGSAQLYGSKKMGILDGMCLLQLWPLSSQLRHAYATARRRLCHS